MEVNEDGTPICSECGKPMTDDHMDFAFYEQKVYCIVCLPDKIKLSMTSPL